MSSNFLSVGIDVGSAFSFMSIVNPSGNLVFKPFKIFHNDPDSLKRAASAIKKAEELESKKSLIFLESTGIYHIPLFCYLSELGFDVSIINPLITHSIKNIDIRKVKNDRLDSISIAKLGLTPNLKCSKLPAKLVLELRYLTRKYYDLTDERAAHIIKMKGDLHVVFPQYLECFSQIAGKTSLLLLDEYGSPDRLLRAHRDALIEKISKASRKGLRTSTERYEFLMTAAKAAKVFSCQIDSIYFNIHTTIALIRNLDMAIASILNQIHSIVDQHADELLIQQVLWLQSIPGIGFLSAVTIMCEIGDFSVFKSPKQLFAYFGMDPAVKESGKFKATSVHMSKRGSRIARRAIFAAALACIRKKRNGEALQPYLYEYYQQKSVSKPKMVALGAIMHKVCNIIFAVLRDQKSFELRSPAAHRTTYVPPVHLSQVA